MDSVPFKWAEKSISIMSGFWKREALKTKEKKLEVGQK